MNLVWYFLAGLFSGVLSGMGMGGGTVLIPILTLFLSMGQHAAQGVNMLAFLPGAALALFIHRRDGRLKAKTAFPLLIWGGIGAIGGAFLATCLDAEWLKKAFGIFLIILSVFQFARAKKKKDDK